MTYIEKYMQLHPTANRENVISGMCPDVNLLKNLSGCHFSGAGACKKCWNREMQENEEVKLDEG